MKNPRMFVVMLVVLSIVAMSLFAGGPAQADEKKWAWCWCEGVNGIKMTGCGNGGMGGNWHDHTGVSWADLVKYYIKDPNALKDVTKNTTGCDRGTGWCCYDTTF